MGEEFALIEFGSPEQTLLCQSIIRGLQALANTMVDMMTMSLTWLGDAQAELCKQEVFRQVEDRPVLKQRTRFMREHHIFEKTYVREVSGILSVGMHDLPRVS